MPLNQWLPINDFQKMQRYSHRFSWLSEDASMTNQLESLADEPLKIILLNAGHQNPTIEERQCLKIAQRRRVYVREVVMQVNSKPWMFGRTVLPPVTIRGAGGQLRLLGERSLGSVLFKNKLNFRWSIEVAKITREHCLYPEFLMDDQNDHLWSRRSFFYFKNSPLIVQEVFLPDCPILQGS